MAQFSLYVHKGGLKLSNNETEVSGRLDMSES